MIDSIRITLPKFSGNFDNCRKVKPGSFPLIKGDEKPDGVINYENYLLSNKSHRKPHSLSVTHNTSKGKVVIEGSLRKWATNKVSIEDLTSDDFHKVLRKLAKSLRISFEELLAANISSCEIGLNVRTRIPCEQVVERAKRYSKWYKEVRGTTGYFTGKAKSLKIYDKWKEISDKDYGRHGEERREAYTVLREKGYHFLRIEFTLEDKQAFAQNGMKKITNLGDLLKNYGLLYEFWAKEVPRIVIFDRIDTADATMAAGEYLLGNSLNYIEFENFIETYLGKIKTKTIAGTHNARSKEYKKIIIVIDKFSSKEYNRNKFRSDVTKQIIRISKKDDQLDFRKVFRELWQIKPSRQKNYCNK